MGFYYSKDCRINTLVIENITTDQIACWDINRILQKNTTRFLKEHCGQLVFHTAVFLFCFVFKDLIYLTGRDNEREREHKQGKQEREKQASRRAESRMQGSIPEPQDCDLSRRQTLNDWVTQALPYCSFLNLNYFFSLLIFLVSNKLIQWYTFFH